MSRHVPAYSFRDSALCVLVFTHSKLRYVLTYVYTTIVPVHLSITVRLLLAAVGLLVWLGLGVLRRVGLGRLS